MQEDYEELVEKLGREIADAILDKEPKLAERARLIDKEVAERKPSQGSFEIRPS